MANIVLLKDLHESHQFVLNYIQETNVNIGFPGTSTKPPFTKLNVWRPDENEPMYYDVKVDLNDVIVQGKF